MTELVLEATQEADGGFVAECLSESIFTQADTWDELRDNVREAINAFFLDIPKSAAVRLHSIEGQGRFILVLGEHQRSGYQIAGW